MTKLYTGQRYLYGESWPDYLTRMTYTGDINQMQRDNTRAIVGAISAQTRAILLGKPASTTSPSLLHKGESGREVTYTDPHTDLLISAFGHMADRLDRGFDGLSSQLSNVSRSLDTLNSTFEWGFGEILASLGGIQDTLETLIKTVKKPSKNYSYEKFDDARDAFERGLYPECLDLLNVAINGDHVSSGYKLEWRFYLLKGIIQLGSAGIDQTLINLPEAESMFLLTARYAKSLDRHEAAKAMLQAGWAAFVQKRLGQARQYIDEAVTHDANLGEAWYSKAKFAMAAKDPQTGIHALARAIDLDIGYIVKADTDGDFSPYRTDLTMLLEALREEVLNRVLACPSPAMYSLRCPSIDEIKQFGLLELFKYQKASKAQIAEHLQMLEERAKQEQQERVVQRELAMRVERERIERENRAKAERAWKDEYFKTLREKYQIACVRIAHGDEGKDQSRKAFGSVLHSANSDWKKEKEWMMYSEKFNKMDEEAFEYWRAYCKMNT